MYCGDGVGGGGAAGINPQGVKCVWTEFLNPTISQNAFGAPGTLFGCIDVGVEALELLRCLGTILGEWREGYVEVIPFGFETNQKPSKK